MKNELMIVFDCRNKDEKIEFSIIMPEQYRQTSIPRKKELYAKAFSFF